VAVFDLSVFSFDPPKSCFTPTIAPGIDEFAVIP
jgi:hypothetical protein